MVLAGNIFLVGPGTGDYQVLVTDGAGGQVSVILGANFVNEARQTLYSESLCADATRVFTVNSDVAGFGVDAVLI